ncbi:MAG TPA: cytochrome c peroxidase [Burkholderiales bacterium]|nr:cytochrome c peroxidase [Burkholderiales bacterium]
MAALLAAFALTAKAQTLPIFDAHLHYSHDAWDVVPVQDVIAILRKAGVKRALVSSAGDDGQQRLYAAAPDLIIPECTPPLDGTRLESPHYVLAFRPEAIEVARHFAVEVAACAKAGSPAPRTLKLEATMPEHGHGMNYAPQVKQLAPGRWRAEGLMFHMPGKWEIVFVVDGERMAHSISLSQLLQFEPAELQAILRHGPWPPPWRPDPSNRVSGKPEAIKLGERLFFEPRLSGPGSVLCASCHVPFRGFHDARPRAFGLEQVDRNTPSLLNARFNRWFGWDGAQDNLWAQSIRPLLDPREMKSSAAHVAKVVRTIYEKEYRSAFGRSPPADEELLVDVGKALAAFQETLVTGRTPFDEFRDALERGDPAVAARYPQAAQRGLRIFVGKGNCSVCHFGPQFTNGEFADIGVPFFVAPGRVDPGRHGGIQRLKASLHNLLGRYNDDASRATATGTRHVDAQQRNFGEFRVPGLRNVARTAPYMHNGSLATLRDVVRYYSELNEERLHADGEKILRPLHLSEADSDDLVAFLESLTAE